MFGSLVELCPAAGVALLLLNNTGIFCFLTDPCWKILLSF